METVRPPAVSGMFYPDNPRELSSLVGRMLEDAKTAAPAPKALIAPHAGYIYSGPIAASVYACLLNRDHPIRRVVLLGPAHRVAFRGMAVPGVDHFQTPLGNIPLDHKVMKDILNLTYVIESDEAHAQEHSLEVQLPFLQKILDDGFTLIPIVVGDARPEEVAEVLERLWNGDNTLIVISSDLTHYLDYETARKIDSITSHAIETLHPEEIRSEQACGRIPIQGLLFAAKRHNLHARIIDLRNSGDTAGPRNQVVGYGAYVFE